MLREVEFMKNLKNTFCFLRLSKIPVIYFITVMNYGKCIHKRAHALLIVS